MREVIKQIKNVTFYEEKNIMIVLEKLKQKLRPTLIRMRSKIKINNLSSL